MTTPAQQQMPDADAFLLGGGVASAKFPAPGSSVTGRITERPTVSQQSDFTTGEPLFWNDGSPRMQLVVTIASDQRDPAVHDDDGTRRIYVKGNLKKAVADAVRRSGARGLEVGGVLRVTYTRDGEKTNPRFAAPKEYAAEYTPAAANELHTPDPVAPPTAPAAGAPGGVVQGLTPEQIAQAQANPATAALLAQMQAAAQQGQTAAGGDIPNF